MRIGLILLLVGIGGTYRTFQEWRLSWSASSQAQEISLQELQSRGAAGNPHVQVTGFTFGKDFVYTKPQYGDGFTKVWVPIVPGVAGSNGLPTSLPAEGIRVLVRSDKPHNMKEVDRFCERTTVKGLIVNGLDSLPDSHVELLRRNYPGTDFSKVMILDEGREPLTASGGLLKQFGLFAGAMLLGFAILGGAMTGKA